MCQVAKKENEVILGPCTLGFRGDEIVSRQP